MREMAKREQAKKTDKYLTFPFSELTPDKKMKPELKEQVSRLEKQEEDFLAGTATLCLHCPFCTEELLLLDKRPDIQNLVWCSASTGEEHSSCTERRHWKGAAGDIALDDEEEEDDDDDDDGGGEQQQQEEGGEQ